MEFQRRNLVPPRAVDGAGPPCGAPAGQVANTRRCGNGWSDVEPKNDTPHSLHGAFWARGTLQPVMSAPARGSRVGRHDAQHMAQHMAQRVHISIYVPRQVAACSACQKEVCRGYAPRRARMPVATVGMW